MFFGEKIRLLRKEKGLVLRKVAAKMDIDTASLSKIELGERHAKREHLRLISELYNFDIYELEKLWLIDKVFRIIKDEEQGLIVLKEVEVAIKNKDI